VALFFYSIESYEIPGEVVKALFFPQQKKNGQNGMKFAGAVAWIHSLPVMDIKSYFQGYMPKQGGDQNCIGSLKLNVLVFVSLLRTGFAGFEPLQTFLSMNLQKHVAP